MTSVAKANTIPLGGMNTHFHFRPKDFPKLIFQIKNDIMKRHHEQEPVKVVESRTKLKELTC